MKTWKIVLVSVSLTLLVEGLAAMVVVYSGAYDVAATVEHSRPVHWLLSKTTERSIAVRADDGKPFVPLADRSAGFKAYDTMCVQCHGAPGVEPSWLGKGIYPRAPDLAKVAEERTPEEIRLAMRRGIKFTSMPALEPTHSATELDELTGFVVALRGISREEYEGLRRANGGTGASPQKDGDHQHGH